MTDGGADDLRHLFITKANSRLKFTLRDHPELATHIEQRVHALAQIAKFELVRDGADTNDAKKYLRKFVEIIAARFRRERVNTQADFDSVWRTVPKSANEYCRRWFKRFDPNVYC